MTSKEALKEWLEITIPYSYWLQAHDYKKIIEQDLERLEKLEEAHEKILEKLVRLYLIDLDKVSLEYDLKEIILEIQKEIGVYYL